MATKIFKKTYLTDAAVERRPRPAKEREEVSDVEPGLFLYSYASGRKAWAVHVRLPDSNGKRTKREKLVIGEWPAMNPADARVRARVFVAAADNGTAPSKLLAEEATTTERKEAEAHAGTFQAVAEEWCKLMDAGKPVDRRKRAVTEDTAAGRKSLLKRRVFPAIGRLPLADVTPQDVNRLLNKVEADDGPVDNTLKVIRLVYRFAASRAHFSGQAPTSGLRPRQAPVKEVRALADSELVTIWAAAKRVGWPYGHVVRALMLTGQRRREIAFLKWSEVDFVRKLIVIPAERTKNRAGEHEVPITPPLEAILTDALARCEALEEKSELVFPSAVSGEELAGWHRLKDLFDRAMQAEMVDLTDAERRAIRAGGALRPETRHLKAIALAKLEAARVKPWTLHGLRHTLVTRLLAGEENEDGELLWSPSLDTVQAVVNHELSQGVTKVYDHSDMQRRYRLKKREALNWWASRLMVIVGEVQESNVVPLLVAERA